MIFLSQLLITRYLVRNRDRANPQLAIFLENYVFGTYLYHRTQSCLGRLIIKIPLQLISATGALPGDSTRNRVREIEYQAISKTRDE